jgi:hypothetical protein
VEVVAAAVGLFVAVAKVAGVVVVIVAAAAAAAAAARM